MIKKRKTFLKSQQLMNAECFLHFTLDIATLPKRIFIGIMVPCKGWLIHKNIALPVILGSRDQEDQG
jgi:hypothetical protein